MELATNGNILDRPWREICANYIRQPGEQTHKLCRSQTIAIVSKGYFARFLDLVSSWDFNGLPRMRSHYEELTDDVMALRWTGNGFEWNTIRRIDMQIRPWSALTKGSVYSRPPLLNVTATPRRVRVSSLSSRFVSVKFSTRYRFKAPSVKQRSFHQSIDQTCNFHLKETCNAIWTLTDALLLEVSYLPFVHFWTSINLPFNQLQLTLHWSKLNRDVLLISKAFTPSGLWKYVGYLLKA